MNVRAVDGDVTAMPEGTRSRYQYAARLNQSQNCTPDYTLPFRQHERHHAVLELGRDARLLDLARELKAPDIVLSRSYCPRRGLLLCGLR